MLYEPNDTDEEILATFLGTWTVADLAEKLSLSVSELVERVSSSPVRQIASNTRTPRATMRRKAAPAARRQVSNADAEVVAATEPSKASSTKTKITAPQSLMNAVLQALRERKKKALTLAELRASKSMASKHCSRAAIISAIEALVSTGSHKIISAEKDGQVTYMMT